MNKTRFQLPPRHDAAVGVDRWVSDGTGVADLRHTVPKAEFAPDRGMETSASPKSWFMFDPTTLLAANRCNLEAMTAANRALLLGVQSIARRNVEMLHQTIDAMSEHVAAMSNRESPRNRAMRQTETAIKAYEDASDYVQEQGSIIQHANSEALEVLAKRFSEAADEMKSLARAAARDLWNAETKPALFWQVT